jgi:hypothetical protein
MKKTFILLLVLFFIASCNVFEVLDERLIWPISLPAFYLKNSTDNTISVESYYFDKHTNQDKLWERQDILPGETKQVMDWVYPTRLCVYIDDCLVSDYVGSSDKLNKDELEAGQLRKVSTGENLEKVEWCDIPSDKYDFGWLPIRENSHLFGRRRYNLVFGE